MKQKFGVISEKPQLFFSIKIIKLKKGDQHHKDGNPTWAKYVAEVMLERPKGFVVTMNCSDLDPEELAKVSDNNPMKAMLTKDRKVSRFKKDFNTTMLNEETMTTIHILNYVYFSKTKLTKEFIKEVFWENLSIKKQPDMIVYKDVNRFRKKVEK